MLTCLAIAAFALDMYQDTSADPEEASLSRWRAGDHHVHSEYSVGWDDTTAPPTPILAGDAIYPIRQNVAQAQAHGLEWMVSTDHGGPNHARLNLDDAYPDLLEARHQYPGMIVFYGMEFDTPGADHSALILPHTHDEAHRLYALEQTYAKREAWPRDPDRDTPDRMIDALEAMRDMSPPPVLIAHHPSRSATGAGEWGRDDPAELRAWNDTAPNVAVGMEGSPGHQAATLTPFGAPNLTAARASYRRHPTYGGYDQMTAQLGGFWDSMLAEGRRWWITASSDSHKHWREGGADFWPGEYSKTWVHAPADANALLDAVRAGHVFVTTGDLIDELALELEADSGARTELPGQTLRLDRPAHVTLRLEVRDPDTENFGGRNPRLNRIDVIRGDVTGHHHDPDTARHAHVEVIARFGPADWEQEGELIRIELDMGLIRRDGYIRLRGTNTNELEPAADPLGENPWDDLWFYTNPVFVEMVED